MPPLPRLTIAASAVVAILAGLLVALVGSPGNAGALVPTPVLEQKVIGHSVQGRAIVAYHLGDRTSRTKALLIGQMHGDEHAGVTLTDSILAGARSIQGINLWIVPSMNPDGDHLHTRQNAHHVDLNRNWPDHWKALAGYYYSGPRPMSEPETRAMYGFLRWLRPHYVVVLHQPLYAVDTTDGGRLDAAFRNRLSANLGLPEKPLRCWSSCHGSLTGWFTTHHLGIGETVEFGSHPSTSYLLGRARWGIVNALGGSFGTLSAHNPRMFVQVTGHAGSARVSGWAFDVDQRWTALAYTVRRDGRWVARWRTRSPSPKLDVTYGLGGTHGYSLSVPMTPGRHTICVTYWNVGAGTSDPRVCRSVVAG